MPQSKRSAPLEGELFPASRARIVRALVERVKTGPDRAEALSYVGTTGGISGEPTVS